MTFKLNEDKTLIVFVYLQMTAYHYRMPDTGV